MFRGHCRPQADHYEYEQEHKQEAEEFASCYRANPA